MRKIIAVCAITVLMTGQASAHVVLAEPRAEADSYYAGEFRLGHGCEDSPTVAVRVELPDDVLVARPQPKPGWELHIEREALAAPAESHGQPVTERVSAVTWRGRLPADQFDTFGLMIRTPAHGGALAFHVVQTCEAGSAEWTPSLELAPPNGAHAH